MSAPGLADALDRAERHAPYLRKLIARYPDVAARPLDYLTPTIDDDLPLGQVLRVAKAQLALGTALGDLAGLLDLESVVGHLSAFADHALDRAVRAAIAEHVPGAEPAGLAVIALGKHGSRELNYSSDLDPILIFDPARLPTRPHEESGEAAVRIGRKIIELMQARDEFGYVFRMDLRLRPSPEVTPIVLPVDAAMSYYESEALAWERAAFIRARACAGDMELGRHFLEALRPFVWRRGLDFGAVQDIRSISHRIRDHHAKGQGFGPGYDLKRGRGGIRECEFFAQIHQMIHGGRDTRLRVPATLDALSALAQAGRIETDDAESLGTAYRLYRTIEHRLQMVDDQQTHALPQQQEALDHVAQLHGLADGGALLALLAPSVEQVGLIYDGLDGDREDLFPQDESQLVEAMAAAGFPDPLHAAQRVSHWRSGTVRAVRSPAARDALEAVLPQIVAALGAAHDPMRAINQLSTLIERLPSVLNLFRLLMAQPALLRLLTSILVHAPTLAEALARRTELLDRLIDATAFDPPGPIELLQDEMRIAGTLEDQLDHVRHVVGDHRFALGVQVLEGACDPLDAAAGYARVAEAAINNVADASVAEFQRMHGKVPGSELVILALGRMGGAELTHASDLDLIYLFTGAFDAESDGQKPLGAVLYYNRLSQRVTAGLSVPTAAGRLYDIDTRLRPSGNHGPLSVSLDAFRKYQLEDAWTWEHMALTRARVVYGSHSARAELDAIVSEALNQKRDKAKLRADASKMRADMRTHKPPKSPLDVKLADGGLVDLEFAVHVKQLSLNSGFAPQLGVAIDQLIALRELAPSIKDAYQLMTRLLVALRLFAPDLVEPDRETCALIARSCGLANWPTLLEQLAHVRQEVSGVWAATAQGDR